MRIDIRVYKRWDVDLIAFCDAGYPLAQMMRDAVCAYANAQPLHYLIDEQVPFSINGKQSFHLAFYVSNKDKNTTFLLKNLKPKQRNSFCKMVFRNALIQQDLCCYFGDDKLNQLHNVNLSFINLYAFQNVKRCSELRNCTNTKMINKDYLETKQLAQSANVNGFFIPNSPGSVNILEFTDNNVNKPADNNNTQIIKPNNMPNRSSDASNDLAKQLLDVNNIDETNETGNVNNDENIHSEDVSIQGASNVSLLDAFLSI